MEKYVYDMEAYPFAANNTNTGLSCEDVIKVSGIFRSSLGNPEHAIEDARSFADRFSPTDKTLHQFISNIVRHDNDSWVEESRSSQINTRTEKCVAQDTHDLFSRSSRPDCEQTLKQKDICCHGKLCTHLLDLIILCMAAATNFTATVKEKGWNSSDKCLHADSSHDESEKTGNSFRFFSLNIWKRGVKSVGLFRDRTPEAVPQDDERTNNDDTAIVVENNNKEAEDKDKLKEIHVSKQKEIIKCTEKSSDPLVDRSSPSTIEQVTENRNIQKVVQIHDISKERTRAGGTPQTDTAATRNLPNLLDICLKSELVDGNTGEAKEYSTATVKKLQLEKEILREERSALRTQAESLIKENGEIKASLGKLKTKKENLTRQYKQLQGQFDEHVQSTRQHTFMLNTRLERLQHAKLAADQGCLKLSLKQERLVVYEQHVSLICHRITKTVRRELEQTQDLFEIEKAECKCSTTNSTWNEGPVDGEGLTMYEAHHRLEKHVLKLIKRYRAVIQLLTGAKGKDESCSHFSTIEEGKVDLFAEYEHFELQSDTTTESDSRYCVGNLYGVSARDIRVYETRGVETEGELAHVGGQRTRARRRMPGRTIYEQKKSR